MSEGSSYSAFPWGERGGDGPEREVSGFGRPLRRGGVGFDGAKPTSVIPTPRYAAVVTPNFNGGEKRLVFATPKEPCTDLTRQNSPAVLLLNVCLPRVSLAAHLECQSGWTSMADVDG